MLETAEVATDHRLGFRSLEREVSLDALPVDGNLPAWLTGTLIRTGPAKFEVGDRSLRHWFDGLAMLHKFSFRQGNVSYANRFLRSSAFEQAQATGEVSRSEFATDPCRSIFKRVTSTFSPTPTDNCNVNLTRLAGQYVAMTETPLPVVFDPETLDTLGVAYRPPGQHTTAHPHHDPDRGELLNYATHFGPRSTYRVYAKRDAADQRLIASIPVREPSYMHSFGMSERYVVLVEFPLVVNPLRLGLGGRPFIENYRWQPERGTRFLVIDRHDGTLRGTYEAEPFFAFHHVNAFERGSELVVDIAAYKDAGIIDALYLDALRSEQPDLPDVRLRRYRIGLESGEVTSEELSQENVELPRINYRRFNARPYRYVYGAGSRAGSVGAEGGFLDALVKVDVESGETETWHEPGCHPGEPVFVPGPDAAGEDEGVALSVVLDARRGTSFLLVLDAADFQELARAEVPHHIPFGFHGQYFGDL